VYLFKKTKVGVCGWPPESEGERALAGAKLGRALVLIGELAAAEARLEEGLALARRVGARDRSRGTDLAGDGGQECGGDS